MKKFYSKVSAKTHCEEVPVGHPEHPEGGFVFWCDGAKMSGCMEGQAIALGVMIGELMNHDWMGFEERMEYANLLKEAMESVDETGEARRVMHLATRDKDL